MPDFLQSWEDRVPMGIVLTEAEEAAIIVLSEVMGVPRSILFDGIQYASLAHRYKELMNDADEAVFQQGHGQKIRGAELSIAEDQLSRLASFIMSNVPGEPTRGDEGAGDCAARVIREQKQTIVELTRQLDSKNRIMESREFNEEPPL